LGLLVLFAVSCAPAAPRSLEDRLHPCTKDEGPSGAYCGSLTVFENREAAAGRRIRLAIVVLPALGDDHEPDPLVFLAGGPGQGAARMADAVAAAFRRVQRRRDIVLVDQRGTGDSNGLHCHGETGSLQDAFATEERALARLRDCLAGLDADVRFYTTPIAMDDLDDVREYLGYDRVNLYGGSYGTRAALVYLRRHGQHVRSMVLDGAAPTDMRLPLYAARDAGRALERLLADCDAETACRSAYPGLAHRVQALIARLDRSPARVRLVHPRTGAADTVDVTARAVASVIFGALYSPVTGSMLPLLLDRAEHNDFQGLLALGFAGDTSENMSTGMQLSVLCSEDAPAIGPHDLERATQGRFFGVHLAAGQLKACEIWPRGEIDPAYYEPVVSAVPALVLSGDIDPVTPPSWGDAVVRHLSSGRHFVAPATGHGVAGTACGARLIAGFLDRADAGGLEASCLATARRPPFFVTPTGPDPATAPQAPSE
jgi:pimeloyl-ACP methyl ester carboxylesterase